MDVETAIRRRRAIKAFDPSHRIEAGETAKLIELATLSPTAFNLQHWRFVVVRDPLVRFQLRQAAYDQPQVTDASLLIVLCADVKAWDRNPARCWRNVEPPERDRMAGTIRRFYASDAQLQRDEAMRSCGLAAQTLMLAATALGHGSCPMDGFDFAAVARILNLPPDHLVSMFVAIGRALEPAGPRPGTIPTAELTVVDRFATADRAAERHAMVEEIARYDRSTSTGPDCPALSSAVLETLARTPRHRFVPADQQPAAYANRPLFIGHGQTISQPYIVALMTELLETSPGDTVLEVGTGSGYQAAVLAEMGVTVHSIEIVVPLARRARRDLAAAGYAGRVTVYEGDGYTGLPDLAPFAGVIVTAAPDQVPEPLIEQLKPGGRLVIPVGSAGHTQELMLVVKGEDGVVRSERVVGVRFVPLTRDEDR